MPLPTDPNQARVAVERFPLMLYAGVDHHVIVHGEAEEEAARRKGFTDFSAIDKEQDHIEKREQGWLVDRAVTLIRANLWRLPKDELVERVRDLEAKESARLAEAAAPIQTPAPEDEFAALDDDGLRALLTARDGKPPHHRLGRDKLLLLARETPAVAVV